MFGNLLLVENKNILYKNSCILKSKQIRGYSLVYSAHGRVKLDVPSDSIPCPDPKYARIFCGLLRALERLKL